MDINIKDIIDNKDNFPAIFLGVYSLEFKKNFTGSVYRLSNIKDVSDIVSMFMEKSFSNLIVLDNIGFLVESAVRSLLKFIEEADFPIALLSYNDRIPDVILSRMKNIYTKPVFSVGEFDFISYNKCLSSIIEQDLSDYDRIINYSLHCPIAYYFEKSGSSFNQDKRILKLISTS